MINQLPIFLRNDIFLNEIIDSESNQIDQVKVNVSDLEDQLNISSATWALSIYEKDLGIKTDISKSYNDRRSVIFSKLRGVGKFEDTLVKSVALSWTGGQIDVVFDGKINITFIDVVGIPLNIQDFKDAIEDIKPVYLDVIYKFLYNTWEKASTKTWGEIESYTWEQVLSGDTF